MQVIDFTKLADKLWGRKNVATAAIFLQKTKPDTELILHLVANRNFSNANRLFLDFEHYDFHFLSQNDAIYNPHVWKAHLLGGGRIVQLIDRLSTLPTLKEYLKENNGWVVREGFIKGTVGKKASYITGKKLLPTEALTENGIDYKKLTICDIEEFDTPSREEIYTPPHILWKANIGKDGFLIDYSDEYIVFKDKIIGIHGSQKELKDIYQYLKINSSLLRFYILASSGQILVNRATALLKDDLLNIPYTENLNDIKLSDLEKTLVKDALNIYREKYNLSEETTNRELILYLAFFCKTLNSIYRNKSKQFQVYKILDTENYFAVHFEYSEGIITSIEEKIVDLEQYIQEAIPQRNDKQQHLHIQKIMKVYGKDSIILVKPKQLRYWLPSIALRDADEVFADYVKARY